MSTPAGRMALSRSWREHRARRRQQGKQFFFEKKNQKTFARLSRTSRRQPRKSFCFFFQKEALSS